MSKMLRLTDEQLAVHNARVARRPSQRLLNSEQVERVPARGASARTPTPKAAPGATVSEGWPVFEAMLRTNKLPAPCYEFRFNAERKWRFDMAFPQHRIAIEVDGGVWSEGRHTRGQGFLNDMEKLNAAVCAGWSVLRYTPDTLPRAIDDLKLCLERHA